MDAGAVGFRHPSWGCDELVFDLNKYTMAEAFVRAKSRLAPGMSSSGFVTRLYGGSDVVATEDPNKTGN